MCRATTHFLFLPPIHFGVNRVYIKTHIFRLLLLRENDTDKRGL